MAARKKTSANEAADGSAEDRTYYVMTLREYGECVAGPMNLVEAKEQARSYALMDCYDTVQIVKLVYDVELTTSVAFNEVE